MRSLAELTTLAEQNHLEVDPSWGSRELMDALRDKLGVADPSLDIDPMKAKDLKADIDWGGARPFEKVVQQYGNANHIVEPKLDGARVRIVFGTTKNSIPTGRRSDVSFGYIDRADNFPQVSTLVVPELAGTVLDAEVMLPEGVTILSDRGWTKGSLNSIMAVLNINPAKGVARQKKHGWAQFHVFDVLAVAGESTQHLPQSERRDLLKRVLTMLEKEWMSRPSYEETSYAATFPYLELPEYEVTEERLQWLIDQGFEGGMIKDVRSRYVPGGRTDAWLKVKKMSTGDFFIIGSVDGKGRNEGMVGSLKVAYFDPDSKGAIGVPAGAVYVADVRGFSDAVMRELSDLDTGGVKDEYLGKVIEIMGQGRTKNDRIRHPHFIRFRPDKTAADCDRTQLELFSEV